MTIYPGFSCEGDTDVKSNSAALGQTFVFPDASGVAEVALTMSGATLYEANPVAGRVLVVSDSSNVKLGCGVITPTKAELVSLGDYPGYTGGREVRGLLAVEDAEGGLRTHGTIVGLEPSLTGGWHIHSGYSCAEN